MMGAILSGYLLLSAAALAVARSRLERRPAFPTIPAAPRITEPAKVAGSPLALVALFLLIPLGGLLRRGAGAEMYLSDLLLAFGVVVGGLLARRARKYEGSELLEGPRAVCRWAIPVGLSLISFAVFELLRGRILGRETGESLDPYQMVRLSELAAPGIQLRAALGAAEVTAITLLLGAASGPGRAAQQGGRWLLGALGLGAALQLGVEWQIHGVLRDARALFVRFHEQRDLTLPFAPGLGEEMERGAVVYVPRLGDLRYDASHGKSTPEMFGDAPIERLVQEGELLRELGPASRPRLLIAADREAPLGTLRAVSSAASRIDPAMGIDLLLRTDPTLPEACTAESCATALATVQAVSLGFQRRARARATYNQLRLGEDGAIEGEAPAGRGVTLRVSERARYGQLAAALGALASRGVGPVEVEVEGEPVASREAGAAR
jgi:hypothetical protein